MGTLILPSSSSADPGSGLQPDAWGAIEYNMQPQVAGAAGSILVSGTIYGIKVPIRRLAWLNQGITTVQMLINTAGATLSGSKIGIYDLTLTAANKLAESAGTTADTTFATTNHATCAVAVTAAQIQAAYQIAPYVYVAWLPVGTTPPIPMRASNATASQLQWGGTQRTLPFCNLGALTAQSSLPATIDLRNNSAIANSYLCGLK